MKRTVAWTPIIWALIPLAMAAVVYFPITHSYFWADDFYSLYRLNNGALVEFLFTPLGDHLLVSTFGIFYLSHLAFGTHPEPYFVTVLMVHLVNVAVFFLVLRRVTHSDRAACFGALLWGTSPRLAGSLGWYSVFGHVIVGMAALLILCDLTALERSGSVRWQRSLGWMILSFVAATSFGTGIGVVLAFPAVALLVVRRPPVRARAVAVMLAGATAVPLLYIALNHLVRPRYTAFSLLRRLGNAVNGASLALFGDLVSYGIGTTPLGALWPVPSFPGLLPYLVAALFLVVLLVPLIGGPPRSRRYVVAALLLMAGCYIPVAAGRGGFYALSAGIAASDRYHYVAALAITLAFCVGLVEAGRRIRLPSRAATALLLVWASSLITMHLAYGPVIDNHDGARRETAHILEQIRLAVAEVPPNRDVYIENRPFRAMGPLFIHANAFPGWAGVFVIFFPDNVVDGRRVRFVEPRRRYFGVAKLGRRSATLLVPSVPPPSGSPPG